jgi:site-specific recombinase XerD
MSLYVYTNTINQYCRYFNTSPDRIIADVKIDNLHTDPTRIEKHRKFLEDCLAELQDRGLSPGRIHAYAKHVRTFYRVNGIEIRIPYLPRPRIVHKDRAPKPDELQRLIDSAGLREKVIISMLALGGFREGTLVRLQYRHVKEDIERGIIPVLIHVEPEITKGKYHDYDALIGRESVEFLKLYLDARRKGLLDRRIPREDIHDNSPLIRDHQTKKVKSIGEKQLYKVIHSLYSRVGLLKQNHNGGYDLRVHSLRKYFKTQLTALGVQPDYIDYMMGHTVDTYHDIQSKGVEFLRNIYTSSGFSIAPKQKGHELEALKAFARGLGLDPEKVIINASFSEPHRICVTSDDQQQAQTRALSIAIKELIKKELVTSENPTNPRGSLC